LKIVFQRFYNLKSGDIIFFGLRGGYHIAMQKNNKIKAGLGND